MVVNPTPQTPNTVDATAGTNGDKLVLVFVGLPGRGKTHIARRLARYLEFFHGAPSQVFNTGEYRRKRLGSCPGPDFFAPDNSEGQALRQTFAEEALNDLKVWMEAENTLGRVGILDGSNTTVERRQWILSELASVVGQKVIFVECLWEDEQQCLEHIAQNPDYAGRDPEEAYKDFDERVEHIKSVYETITDGSFRWIKIIDSGRQVVSNRIEGFLPGRILNFLMCVHTTPHEFYLSRHGQSEYNQWGKIGGNSSLTEAGQKYRDVLGGWVEKNIQHDAEGNAVQARLWTSSMRRTKETASAIPHETLADGWIQCRPREWRALDELYAGECDGMTYAEIAEQMPIEAAARKADKLAYRYPRGESYLDVIHRLDPIIHEMERQKGPLLIVGHQGILRIVAAYFTGMPRSEAVSASMPLHTVVKLMPHAYGCKVERIALTEVADSPSC